ncbi:hypothetical protein AAVH_18087 [Aphelenchoides avenae]|nr:hypothetical protein AAVH_18087 [Aphelenchus avenae]
MGVLEMPYSVNVVNYLAERLGFQRRRRSWGSQLVDYLADDFSRIDAAERLIRQLSETGMHFRVMGEGAQVVTFRGLIPTFDTEMPLATEGLRFPTLPWWQTDCGEVLPLEKVYSFGVWTLKTFDD